MDGTLSKTVKKVAYINQRIPFRIEIYLILMICDNSSNWDSSNLGVHTDKATLRVL